MPSGFGELTTQANELVAAGDLAAAQELLGNALEHADPSPANAIPELAEAAALHARVLVTLGDAQAARGWAAFAYSAASRLHGPADPRTVAAAATLAAVLHRVGSHVRAARLYRDVIIELTASDGPESLRVLAAHADLATVEYAQGECDLARDRLTDAWQLHREVYGDGHPSGIKMLARLGAMQRDCGLFTEAHEHLALAQELCRAHLPADHPLALQVAALARAAADPDHDCAGQPSSGTPAAVADAGHVPAGRTHPVPPPRTPEPPAAPHAGPAAPRTGPYADPVTPFAGPYAEPTAPLAGSYPVEYPQRYAPEQPAPADGYPDRYGTAYPDDDRGVSHPDPAAPAPAAQGRDGEWWPPDVAADPDGFDEENDPYGDENWRRAPAGTALPPAVSRFADPVGDGAGPAGETAPGVRAVRNLPVARQQPRLPVHVPRPAAPPGRRMTPIVLAGAVVVLLGTAAVVTGFALAEEPPSQPERPPLRSTTTPSVAAATPGTPPGDVQLRDNRDSITLTWTYPVGAEGPVLVAGGRTGQQPRAFQELDPGSTSFIVYGLPERTDYCFTVAVIWSTDRVGRSTPVCTDRAVGASPGR